MTKRMFFKIYKLQIIPHLFVMIEILKIRLRSGYLNRRTFYGKTGGILCTRDHMIFAQISQDDKIVIYTMKPTLFWKICISNWLRWFWKRNNFYVSWNQFWKRCNIYHVWIDFSSIHIVNNFTHGYWLF
jgi:hypothetical protein